MFVLVSFWTSLGMRPSFFFHHIVSMYTNVDTETNYDTAEIFCNFAWESSNRTQIFKKIIAQFFEVTLIGTLIDDVLLDAP